MFKKNYGPVLLSTIVISLIYTPTTYASENESEKPVIQKHQLNKVSNNIYEMAVEKEKYATCLKEIGDHPDATELQKCNKIMNKSLGTIISLINKIFIDLSK